MRIDVYLAERGLAASRTEAKAFIESEAVTVNGKVITKPSFSVSDADEVTLDRSSKKYASRGGLKLEFALQSFNISVMGKSCLDVGASSGGFTDCLLIFGADRVIAVDSGSGQIIDRLRSDGRVFVIENYNARYMKSSDLAYLPELAVMDVSFISATHIIPAIFECLSDGGEFVCLIKPQFEVGRANIGKGGIVKDARAREGAVRAVVDFAVSVGFTHIGTVTSPITGTDGNIEYLAYFKK
jgi:23S rRNA (cytidine1920-2'-O)/16S rRNA (cytidine1409-2'-O)-methyltransferase